MSKTLERVWVGVGYDGDIVYGGHRRPRLYEKDRETAIKWASQDDRVVELVEFVRTGPVWTKPPRA